MADATLYTATGRNNPIISGPMRPSDFIIRQLGADILVGSILTSTGETGDYVDASTDDQESHAVVVEPVVRPSDTWNADTALLEDTWAKCLRLGTMEYKVHLLINGQDTPVAGVDGAPVYSTATDGSTNDSRAGSATLNATNTDREIGKLAGAFTTGNSTSAANGTYAEVFV